MNPRLSEARAPVKARESDRQVRLVGVARTHVSKYCPSLRSLTAWTGLQLPTSLALRTTATRGWSGRWKLLTWLLEASRVMADGRERAAAQLGAMLSARPWRRRAESAGSGRLQRSSAGPKWQLHQLIHRVTRPAVRFDNEGDEL